MCVRQSSLGSGDESDDGDVKKKKCEQRQEGKKKSMRLNQGSIITWNSIGCCFRRMDVPALCLPRALPALPKSIAASTFKFVLIPVSSARSSEIHMSEHAALQLAATLDSCSRVADLETVLHKDLS